MSSNCLTSWEPRTIPTPADGTSTAPQVIAAVEAAMLNWASRYFGTKVMNAVTMVNSQVADKVMKRKTGLEIRRHIRKVRWVLVQKALNSG